MSVAMSVKLHNASSASESDEKEKSLSSGQEFRLRTHRLKSAIHPVDDTVSNLWGTLISRWISREFESILGGKLGTESSEDFKFSVYPLRSKTPEIGGFGALSGALNKRLTLMISDRNARRKRVAGGYDVCRRAVSPSSLEVFQRLGRDVKTMTALLRIKDVQSRLAVPRSTVYRLIDGGDLERVYIASSPRIVDESVEAYISRLRQPLLLASNEKLGR